MADPNPEHLNSAHVYVQDEFGDTFLHVFMDSDPEKVERAKAHARWYMGYCRRPTAYLDRDSQGNAPRRPIGKTKVVVEYYEDKSAYRRKAS